VNNGAPRRRTGAPGFFSGS